MIYSVDLSKPAIKDLSKLPEKERKVLSVLIVELGLDPYPRGYRKLQGSAQCRLRYGDYRVLYELDTQAKRIIVTRVLHRRNVYRKKR